MAGPVVTGQTFKDDAGDVPGRIDYNDSPDNFRDAGAADSIGAQHVEIQDANRGLYDDHLTRVVDLASNDQLLAISKIPAASLGLTHMLEISQTVLLNTLLLHSDPIGD